jgi:hypothetical protein
MPSSLLPALMDVLDHADAAAAQSREELLKAAQALGTSHTPRELEAAVDRHLAATPRSVAPPAAPYGFAWPRPRTAEEQALRSKQAHRTWGWTRSKNVVFSFFLIGFGVFWGGLSTLMHAFYAWDDAFSFAGIISIMMSPVLVLGFGTALQQAINARIRCHPLEGDLAQSAQAYLRCPETRAYLRAVFSSPVPVLLEGDGPALETLYQKAALAQAAQARRAEEEAQEQARAQERATRMTQFVHGLQK